MCGITGIFAFNEAGRFHLINLQRSTDLLAHRGPDAQGTFIDDKVGLGHRRLSVIDTSTAANQPMRDPSGRYTIVYNGEIYNYKELRSVLEERHHVTFNTFSDTEVLLKAYMIYGRHCLDRLNGFFAFAVYDKHQKELFIARDRFGIKPLFYYRDDDKFLFASEMRSVLAYGIQRSLNQQSLLLYLQLNYIPAPYSILKHVSKLLPGHYMQIRQREVFISSYYSPDKKVTSDGIDMHYPQVKEELIERLDRSVQSRLVADVPVGVFLSGGIDSSLITALASRHKSNLRTFSIGYRNARFFDETKYARLVADYFRTDHHEFTVTHDDMLNHLPSILDHFDEPFADSSAIPVYLLSKLTRGEVTVALSGDGADEVFTGYVKHRAFLRAMQGGMAVNMLRILSPVWHLLPRSRNNFLSNRIRQIDRFVKGLALGPGERYWFWASLMTQAKALSLLHPDQHGSLDEQEGHAFRKELGSGLGGRHTIQDILLADMRLVLPNDMLYKVDFMSMAHGLEVRVPFLDHSVVDFAVPLPDGYKINAKRQKIILRDLLQDLLPGNLHKRAKHGFEVPLLNWLRKDLRSTITGDLLGEELIREQGIFQPEKISELRKQLFSSNPGDAHAHIWALIVFQNWWKKYFS